MRRRTFIGALSRPHPRWGRRPDVDLARHYYWEDLALAYYRLTGDWDGSKRFALGKRDRIIEDLTDILRAGVADRSLRNSLRACLIANRLARFKDHLTKKQLAADLEEEANGNADVLRGARAA